MEYETTLEYTVPVLREAVGGFWRRSVGVSMSIALALYAGMLGFLLLQGDRSWVVGFVAAISVFGTVFVAVVYFVHYRNAIQKFRAMGQPRATFRVTEDSFTVSSGAGTSTLPWSSVTQVWKFKNCWLLLFSRAQFMTHPLACISDDMRGFVLKRVVAAGGRADA